MKKNTSSPLLSFPMSLRNEILKKCVTLSLALIVVCSVFATNYYNVTGATNANNTASWTTDAGGAAGTAPADFVSGDVFTIRTGTTINTNAAWIVTGSVVINGTLTPNQTITVSGSFTNNGTFNHNTREVILGTGGVIDGTSSTTFSTLTINTANAADIVSLNNAQVTIRDNGILNLTNGFFKVGASNQLIATKALTINATGSGNLANAVAGNGLADADGGTLSLIGSSGGKITVNGAAIFNNINTGADGNLEFILSTTAGVNSRVNGTFTISGGGSNQFKASGNPLIWGPASTLYLETNNQFNTGSFLTPFWSAAGTIGVTPGYPNNVTLAFIGISQNGSASNGWGWYPPAGNRSINGVFTLGSGSKFAKVDFTNVSFSCGGFVLNTDSRFKAPASMTVSGDWINNQALSINDKEGFENSNGTVIFSGAAQHIGGTVSTPFYSITVNGTAATNVILDQPVTLPTAGVCTLTTGNIQTTETNILSITNTNTSGITGGSATSYINGPVKWSLNTGSNVYNFPVGKNAAYLPLTLNAANTSNGNIVTLQAFDAGSGGTVDGTLSSLSTTEYWSLGASSGLAGSTISVSRPTAIAPLAYIAKSNTTANGVYTSIGGTAVANGVNNSNDIGTGTSLYFTLGVPPIVSTLAATSITTTGATLQGAFNTQGVSNQTSFTYGTNTSSGLGTPVTIHSPITSNSSVQDSAVITGLTPNTLYTYKATDGVNSGSDVVFITAPNPPTIAPVTTITGAGFTANWTAPAAPGTATYTYTVQVSTDPTFTTGVVTQNNIASGTTTATFTGLTSATQYYVRVQAVNATASSVWSSTGSVTTNVVPSPPCENNTSNDGATTFTNAAPQIDGTVDAVWANAPVNIMNVVTLGNNNNTQTWQSLWTADSLYLLVQVTDASLIGQGAGLNGSVAVPGVQQGTSNNYYEADGIEFYLDPDNSGGPNYDRVNDIQLRFNLGSNTISGQSEGVANQFVGDAFLRVQSLINWKMQVVPGGYLLEAAIPWGKDAANPGVFLQKDNTYGNPASGQTVGLDIGVNDQDNVSGDRQAQIQWHGNSPSSYQHPEQFKSVGLQVCPVAPVVTTPTRSSITATSAVLGATVVSSGRDTQLNISPLTSRGTAFSTTLPVVTNAQAEGNTTLGVYSHDRTELAPQTKYYYLGYANNAAGLTGVSEVDSFYTLSALPTVQPALTTETCAAIKLNWNAITFPPVNQATQTGYLVLRREDGVAPTTTGIATRVATKQADLPAGTTLIATISSGATITYTDATAVTGKTYNYLLVPFTWDGVEADSTFNYFVTGAPGISATIGESITPKFDAVAAICSGGTLNALPLTSTNSITGTWTPALNNTTTTEYTFTPAAGQCATTAKLTITVNQGTLPSFDPVPAICAGGNLNALPLTSTNNFTGTWSPALNNTATTTYTFTPAAGQCATTAQLTITVTQPPTVTAAANPGTITQGAVVTLTGNSNMQGTYTWTAVPDVAIESANALTATSKPNQNTTYTFTVTTQNGCSASDDVTVNVTPGNCLNAPNVFTPNNDGFHDLWVITQCGNYQLRVDVYNRWGGLVFHSDNYGNNWNGTRNGKPIPDGTYYYVIRATSPDGNQRQLTGNVTIMR
ncbi:MAG: sugar-binding protein [Ferruginibacter sp.]